MKEVLKDKRFLVWAGIILLLKIMLLGMFSSDYQNNLFVPFVQHFVTFGGNPWQYVWLHNLPLQFPYHPLMLYVFSTGALLIKFFSVSQVLGCNLLFKLPTLFADLCIFVLLLRSFKNSRMEVLVFYFLSPVILYAAYVHSQLDLVPVAVLFTAFWYLKSQKWVISALLFGIAVCIKMNAVLFLPVFLIYLYKKTSIQKTVSCFLLMGGLYVAVSLPYLLSEGYQALVLFNEKQDLFFDLSVTLGQVQVYVPLFIALIIYARFFTYRQINMELLNLFAVLLISLFLLFVSPSTPAWFIWLIPFLSSFVIKYSAENPAIVQVYWLFNFVYLVYFIFFHIGDYGDVTWLKMPLDLKVSYPFLRNCIFTALEAVLCCVIYCIYQIGSWSNALYRKDRAVVIGIGGDSASGKTSLLGDMQHLLQTEMVYLEGDGDHRWERSNKNWVQYTHLNPKANWLHKQINDILQLKKLEPVYRKEYNHHTGKFGHVKKIMPRPFVVLSGLHPFYLPKMRRIIDLKIYMDTDLQLRKYWKILRDTRERGYCREKVLAEMDKRAIDSKKYIDAQKNFADLLIRYFPLDSLKTLPSSAAQTQPVALGVKITLDSSVNIENIVEDLWKRNVKLVWDYSNDLKTQFLCVSSDLKDIDWRAILSDKIANLDEIIPHEVQFKTGQRGLIQLLILKILSEKMKDSHDGRYFA